MTENKTIQTNPCELCFDKSVFDPIRLVRVVDGKYAGLHKLYISEKVFRQETGYTGNIIRPWWEANPKEWVFADDGFVVQLIDKYEMYNKPKNATIKSTAFSATNPGIIYIFANKIMYIKKRKDGGHKVRRYLGGHVPINKQEVDDLHPFGKYLTEQKRNFVLQVCNSVPPAIAYMKTFNVPYSKAVTKGYRLATEDEATRKEIAKNMKSTILDDLEKHGITGDYILQEIRRTIDENKINSQVRASLLVFLMKIQYGIDQKTPLPGPDPNRIMAHATIIENNPNELKQRMLNKLNTDTET